MSKKSILQESVDYEIARAAELKQRTFVIHPIAVTGSGRFARYTTDKTPKIVAYVKKLGLRYDIGNDSKSGIGQLGKFIRVHITKKMIQGKKE